MPKVTTWLSTQAIRLKVTDTGLKDTGIHMAYQPVLTALPGPECLLVAHKLQLVHRVRARYVDLHWRC